MRWTYDDGGRAAAGFRGSAGDCATRAIAIATGATYRDVYDALGDRVGAWAATSRSRYARRWNDRGRGATARNGTPMPVVRAYLAGIGWRWTPTMSIGSGTTVHLRADELPAAGPHIVRVTRHLCAVVDGVIRDTHDPSRDGTRAVYGYWSPHKFPPAGIDSSIHAGVY